MQDGKTYYHEIDRNNPDIAVIRLGKHVLGGNDALDFTTKMDELNKTALKYLIVDLGLVELINSSGLGMLVSGHGNLQKHEKEMLLTNIPPKVRNLLKMTHLDQVFKIFETMEEAVNFCR